MAKLTMDSLSVLESALDPLLDPTYIVDADFNLLWVNRSFRRVFRYRPRKMLPCFDVVKMDICGTDACLLTRCQKNGGDSRYQETALGGSVEPNATCLAGGRPIHDPVTEEIVAVVGTMRDNSAEMRLYNRYDAMLEAEREHKEFLQREVSLRTKELVTANATLNERNEALAASRREVAGIFENISQAILTIDSDLRVGREYSKFAERVFETKNLSGILFSELLGNGGELPQEVKELAEWLSLIFHSPTLDWEVAQQSVVREYKRRRKSGKDSEIRLSFEPIEEDGRVRSMMILVEDLTEKRELQRAFDAKKREMSDDFDHLSEIAQLDAELYEAIFAEASDIVGRAKLSLARLAMVPEPAAMIDQMFRDMHTLKGNAMTFGMLRIAAKAHWVEDAFSELRDCAGSFTEELVAETVEKVEQLGELFDRLQSMASRVLRLGATHDDGMARDLGQTLRVRIEVAQRDQLIAWVEKSLGEHSLAPEFVSRLRALG